MASAKAEPFTLVRHSGVLENKLSPLPSTSTIARSARNIGTSERKFVSLTLPPSTPLSRSLGTKSLRVPRKGTKSKGKRTRLPSLPPQLEAVLAVPFRIRYVVGSTVAFVNQAPITRAQMSLALGCVCYNNTNSVVGWASSFRLSHITMWPAAGGDVGISSLTSTSTAEQALNKESSKINTLPTGITMDRATRWTPKKGTYLAMWQQSTANAADQLFNYWGTAGSVFDIQGVFTLSAFVQGYGVAVASATQGEFYYLSPDGNTTHNLVPQNLQTTH